MQRYAAQPVPLAFDFNVVISNLNKMNREQALVCIAQLRESIAESAKASESYARQYADIFSAGAGVKEK